MVLVFSDSQRSQIQILYNKWAKLYEIEMRIEIVVKNLDLPAISDNTGRIHVFLVSRESHEPRELN